MTAQIVNKDGSINVISWKANGKTYRISGTRSTGKGVLDAVDRVYCVEDDSYKDYTRRILTGRVVEVVEFAKSW